MDIDEILKKHSPNWISDNFENWKITEIMYCKIGWCINGDVDPEEQFEILSSLQSFIQDLQEIEKK